MQGCRSVGPRPRTPPATTPPAESDDEEPRPTSSRWTDSIRNRLFKARTLIISGEVNQKLASEVIIHDMIRYVSSPVRMVGTGWVAGGEISAPIVIGRDHLDTGSVASPFRETEGALETARERGVRLPMRD